jgi:hypothetical protein
MPQYFAVANACVEKDSKMKRTPDDFAAEMKTRLNARTSDIPVPRRMAHLPVAPSGYIVPWFVSKLDDGSYDFRAFDWIKMQRAVKQKLCWLCGQSVGRRLAFVVGSMCVVNRVTSEPPSHRDCAEYAVCACPFLTQPRMRRNTVDLPEDAISPPGEHLDRNPGAVAIYMTLNYRPFQPDRRKAGLLFELGAPIEITYYREGRLATRAEVLESIDSGMPLLRNMALADGEAANKALDSQYQRALQLLPAA